MPSAPSAPSDSTPETSAMSARGSFTTLETVTLEDAKAGTRLRLAPSRGGIATRFFVGERPIFYLDESTLVDSSKNIRGGSPVLFPSPGPLTNGTFAWHGKTGAMKQHGFARQRPWAVVAHAADSATLELQSDDATRSEYPWDFTATYRYSVSGSRLRIDQKIANRSGSDMPFASGFHPYFFIPQAEKARTTVPTRASRAWDNVAKKEIALDGRPIDLSVAEVDLHLVDHGSSEAKLAFADGSAIRVAGSAEFTRWVVWTLAGKDFVCLEPWTAPADALNTEKDLLVVPPGGQRELWTEFEWVKAPA